MKLVRQNRLPEIWPWLRWGFIGCSVIAHTLALSAVKGLGVTAEAGIVDARPYFDPLFRGHIIYGSIVGIFCLLAFVFGEVWVPKIVKKRAQTAEPPSGMTDARASA
jgi:hypothetical protein